MAAPRVLVVDDDPKFIDLCGKLLRKAGMDAHGVTNGEEAIQLCGRETFDLLLLDLKLQEMDGLEVLNRVRKVQPDAGAIIITGYGTMEAAMEAMRLGAQEFILKPLKGDALVAKVLLQRRDG